MACTPSPRFEEEFEDSTSVYAEEGTAAHYYGELLLRCEQEGDDSPVGEEVQTFIKTNEYYCGEMEEAVGLYIDVVHVRYEAAKASDPNAILMVEQKLRFEEWVPEGFGTGDILIISRDEIEIIDLKYGKGVPVFAEKNPQLRLYGLGAWNAYKMLYDFKRVRMTIVQPRLGSVTEEVMQADDLLRWAEEEVKPKAQQAWEGKGEFLPGDHCKFCKAKARCKPLADYNMELAKYDFVLPHKLTDDEISSILSKLDTLATWTKAIKEYALYEAENKGKKWQGWKLVEGRSNRILTDPDQAVNVLVGAGISEPLCYKPKEVQGITALEKLAGKKKFNSLLDDLLIKPPGKPTLVRETDKRPELNSNASAVADFQ